MKPGDIVLARVPSGTDVPAQLRPALGFAILPGIGPEQAAVSGRLEL